MEGNGGTGGPMTLKWNSKKNPRKNRDKAIKPDLLLAAGLVAACLSFFSISACSGTEAFETAYPDGGRESRTVHLRGSGEAPVRHGVQLSWYPDGGRKSMENFVNGYRQGYAFRWHPDGAPESVERFSDGVRNGQAKYWDADGALIGCVDESGRDCLKGLAGAEEPSRQFAARP